MKQMHDLLIVGLVTDAIIMIMMMIPIVVTLVGIVTDVSPVHHWKVVPTNIIKF